MEVVEEETNLQDSLPTKCRNLTYHSSSSLTSPRTDNSSANLYVDEWAINDKWVDSENAHDHFVSCLTCLYALLAIVYSIVQETVNRSHNSPNWQGEMILYSLMYGLGIIFLGYCYLFIIYVGWYNCIVKFLFLREFITRQSYENHKMQKASHHGEGASLYLRLGVLCFGSAGVVLFGLEILLCFTCDQCLVHNMVNLFLASFFTFLQMHFIFCNSKVIITKHRSISKIVFMHLLAVNVWTWFRFILAKNSGKLSLSKETVNELIENLMPAAIDLLESNTYNDNTTAFFNGNSTLSDNTTSLLKGNETEVFNLIPSSLSAVKFKSYPNKNVLGKITAYQYFGDFTTFIITCIIEYSIVGAGVMFVIWKTIHENSSLNNKKTTDRKNRIKIDCSNTSIGLFGGLIFMICCFVSVLMYCVFYQQHKNEHAITVFRVSDLGLFSVTLICVSIGLLRMKKLNYHKCERSNAEFLDDILLGIGLIGEQIHCCIGIVVWISNLYNNVKNDFNVLAISVFITRLIESTLQALFILIGSRLKMKSEEAKMTKSGKQCVTFLLIANFSLFCFHTLFHTLDMKCIFGEDVEDTSVKNYMMLVYAVAPLVIFYRFHSSVCLAEIWKHCYSIKDHSSNNHHSSKSPSQKSETTTISAIDMF